MNDPLYSSMLIEFCCVLEMDQELTHILQTLTYDPFRNLFVPAQTKKILALFQISRLTKNSKFNKIKNQLAFLDNVEQLILIYEYYLLKFLLEKKKGLSAKKKRIKKVYDKLLPEQIDLSIERSSQENVTNKHQTEKLIRKSKKEVSSFIKHPNNKKTFPKKKKKTLKEKFLKIKRNSLNELKKFKQITLIKGQQNLYELTKTEFLDTIVNHNLTDQKNPNLIEKSVNRDEDLDLKIFNNSQNKKTTPLIGDLKSIRTEQDRESSLIYSFDPEKNSQLTDFETQRSQAGIDNFHNDNNNDNINNINNRNEENGQENEKGNVHENTHNYRNEDNSIQNLNEGISLGNDFLIGDPDLSSTQQNPRIRKNIESNFFGNKKKRANDGQLKQNNLVSTKFYSNLNQQEIFNVNNLNDQKNNLNNNYNYLDINIEKELNEGNDKSNKNENDLDIGSEYDEYLEYDKNKENYGNQNNILRKVNQNTTEQNIGFIPLSASHSMYSDDTDSIPSKIPIFEMPHFAKYKTFKEIEEEIKQKEKKKLSKRKKNRQKKSRNSKNSKRRRNRKRSSSDHKKSKNSQKGKWNKHDISKLKKAVKLFGKDNWSNISKNTIFKAEKTQNEIQEMWKQIKRKKKKKKSKRSRKRNR
ncbi:hypothetical protein M0812_19899 [Anaeramoeba flamelloides]|uniref:Myb-like domain-containing protein n=1 Tax=Anaeramoeba flamelloides TaxID=1746091 RepID=A0AAV7YX04_9EUKA|nr:hypothetical protein M0812_19899 [Anaeramoeba flamelloides]